MAGGIRIGPYQPLDVRTPAVPGGGYIDVDARAGTFSSPLARLGFGARDDEAAVKDADIRLGEAEQALLFAPNDGYLNALGEAALTKAPEVLDAYSKAQEREIESLPDDAQRRMLEALAQRRLTTFGEQVERHGAAERLRWHDAASERRIAQMRTDAGFHWSDDALLRRAIGTTRAEVRDTAERQGWDSALTEATLRQQTSRTLVSAIEAAVEHDPARAQSLRTRYAQHIEVHDTAALDALLSEAQTCQRAAATSAEILNATPPDGSRPTPQWRLSRAEAIADPNVRSATIRHLRSAAATDEARARTLAEQVLARVLKHGLTDSSQIPVREWVALDAERRQAVETRLDHNARGTEPTPNPALVDELASEMTQSPAVFARRDLIPAVAHLALPRWQRFRDWQAGLRRDDPATEDQLYAIKRGLQIATKMLPADTPDDEATNFRAELVEDVDTWRRINGKSPTDADITDMLARHAPSQADTPRTLNWNPRSQPEATPVRFVFPRPDQGDRPHTHRVQDANRMVAPSAATRELMRQLMEFTRHAVISTERAHAAARARLAAAIAAARAIPGADVIAASAAARAIADAMRVVDATAREHAAAVDFDAYVQEEMRRWSMAMTPAEKKKWDDRMREWNKLDDLLKAQGVADADRPPPPEKPPEEEPPEEEPPPDNKNPDEEPHKDMVAKPGQSGKEAANDAPSYAKGIPRRVGEDLDDYVARVMEKQFGENWKQLHPDTGPKSKYSQIRKYGARHWIIPKGGK